MLTAPLQRGKTPTHKMCLGYDTKPSDGQDPILKLWGMWSTPSLLLLPGPLRFRVVVPVRVPSMDQIELFNHLLRIITICYLKQYSCVQIIYIT